MRYVGGDSFPFDFVPNRIPFGSKSKGKLLPRPYLIQFGRKSKYSFLSVTFRIWGEGSGGCGLALSGWGLGTGMVGFRDEDWGFK